MTPQLDNVARMISGGLLQITPDVMYWGEVVGNEPVLNLDIVKPAPGEYAPASR